MFIKLILKGPVHEKSSRSHNPSLFLWTGPLLQNNLLLYTYIYFMYHFLKMHGHEVQLN